jgi:hypothetical protein
MAAWSREQGLGFVLLLPGAAKPRRICGQAAKAVGHALVKFVAGADAAGRKWQVDELR